MKVLVLSGLIFLTPSGTCEAYGRSMKATSIHKEHYQLQMSLMVLLSILVATPLCRQIRGHMRSGQTSPSRFLKV